MDRKKLAITLPQALARYPPALVEIPHRWKRVPPPEETQGTWQGRETGICRGYTAPAGGPQGRGGQATGRLGAAWPGPAGSGRSGNWPTWCSVARRGPLHLIHGGGLALFCSAKVFLTGSSELTITARPTPNAAPARLNVRESIDSFSAQELFDFRRAVKQASALNDKRGFGYLLAGMPWHRLTCTGWSSRSSRRFPGLTLPWWDWSKDGTTPAAYASAQAGGTENVLAKAPSKHSIPRQIRLDERNIRFPGEIPQTPGPPYQQEWGQRDEGHQAFGLQPADLDRAYRCGVNAPPPGAAGASASSPGARQPSARAPAGVLPGRPGDEGPARRARAPTSARGRTGG